MGETARILRYVIPGALMQLPPIAWFVVDTLLCCGPLPQVPDAALIGLAGATLPLGFLASNIYSFWLWRDRQSRPRTYRIFWQFWRFRPRPAFSWTDDDLLLRALPTAGMPDTATPAERAAWVDARWHVAMRNNEATLRRGRGLLDVMNGLASSCMALVLGAVLVPVIFLLLWASDLRQVTTECSLYTLTGPIVVAVSLVLAEMLRRAQFRVAQMATTYIQASLQ